MNPIGGLLKRLPSCKMLLGYGSGVFRQAGYTNQADMVDVLALVSRKSAYLDDLKNAGFVSPSSNMMGKLSNPEIVYFADISISHKVRVKLGVVEYDKCLSRLRDWEDSFYIAGRLQKPIQILYSSDISTLQFFHDAQAVNHRFAIIAALLALPPKHTYSLSDLYTSLVGLSYLGDIRVGIAENPKKIPNILTGQYDLLHGIYSKYLSEFGVLKDDSFQCNLSANELWDKLPVNFQRRSIHLSDSSQSLISTLSVINQGESLHQAIVGVGTTGPLKSLKYLLAKLSKRLV